MKETEMVEASVDDEAVFVTAMSLIEERPGGDRAAVALGLKDATSTDGAPPQVDVSDMARRMERAIAGVPEVTAACRKLLADSRPDGFGCDGVSLLLLRHLGVAAEVAAAIAIMIHDLEIDPIHFEVTAADGRAYGVRVEGNATGMRVEADLAPDMAVVWNAPLIVMRRPLPDTVMTALAGRRLADVLTHPALDGLELTIDSAWNDKKGGTVLSILGSTDRQVAPQMVRAA